MKKAHAGGGSASAEGADARAAVAAAAAAAAAEGGGGGGAGDASAAGGGAGTTSFARPVTASAGSEAGDSAIVSDEGPLCRGKAKEDARPAERASFSRWGGYQEGGCEEALC